jgi:hypothetical protein
MPEAPAGSMTNSARIPPSAGELTVPDEKVVKPSKVQLRAIKELGLSEAQISEVKIKCAQHFGHLLNKKLLGKRLLTVRHFENFDQTAIGKKIATDIMNDAAASAADKLRGVAMLGDMVRIEMELAAIINDDLEKEANGSGAPHARNQPPAVRNTQVNVYTGPIPEKIVLPDKPSGA